MNKVQAWWKEQLEAFLAKRGQRGSPGGDAPGWPSPSSPASGEARPRPGTRSWRPPARPAPLRGQGPGAVKRLTSEGQPFALPATPALDGKPFSPADLAGKVTVVYYWASWGRDATVELKALAELVKTYGPKGLQVVTISLDDEAAKAAAALQAAQLPGTHLHQPGGLDRSPLATAYGIQMVPHIMIVGKDGKVASRNAQSGPLLKDEIEKLTK
ncbi:MAG: redoxin domain-containing protein [Gemmataceae bacterium]